VVVVEVFRIESSLISYVVAVRQFVVVLLELVLELAPRGVRGQRVHSAQMLHSIRCFSGMLR
jgi:hypothetical protein